MSWKKAHPLRGRADIPPVRWVDLDKIDFSQENGQRLLIHTMHILKAIVPAVNLAYLDTLYVHPVIRPIFVTFLELTGSIS